MFSKNQVINNLRAKVQTLEDKLKAIKDMTSTDLSDYDKLSAIEDMLEAEETAPTAKKEVEE